MFDQDLQFIFILWKFLCKRLDSSFRLFTVYHSQINDQSEWANQNVKKYLHFFCSYMQNDWFKWLFMIKFVDNNVMFTVIFLTSFFLNKNFHSHMSFDSDIIEYESIRERLQIIRIKNISDRLIVELSFHIYILTRLDYLSWIFWLNLILISSQSSIQVFNLTHQAIENDVKCQDLLFLNLLHHYIWKTFMQQTNLFLFSLFALFCCIINKIYCMISDSDKTYVLSRSSIEKEFNFLIIHSFTFSNLHSNEFASQDSWNINRAFVEKKQTLQEAMNRIHLNTSLLILRENNQYVEWSAVINAQFQEWWLQMSVDESVINKTQKKIDNSL